MSNFIETRSYKLACEKNAKTLHLADCLIPNPPCKKCGQNLNPWWTFSVQHHHPADNKEDYNQGGCYSLCHICWDKFVIFMNSES